MALKILEPGTEASRAEQLSSCLRVRGLELFLVDHLVSHFVVPLVGQKKW